MKKISTFRTLLVGLLALGATSAWAETFTGTVKFAAMSRITNNGDGTLTTAGNAGNAYALGLADLSSIKNIGGATSVTLDFDVKIPSGSRWLIGIGDKNTRGTDANGSSKSTYNTDGLIMRFGTTDGLYYRINGGTNNTDAFGVSAHCTFTLDVVNNKYSYTITNGENTFFSGENISTTVTAATVVEVYSWLNNATITISDVSYSFEYEAASYTYTINATDEEGNILETVKTGLTTEPSVTVTYPYAIKVGNYWYTTSATTYGVEVSALNTTANITYSKDESIVGFFEGESEAGDKIRFSNGAFGTVAAQNKRDRGISAGTLTPGVYQFVGRLVNDGNSGRAITIREGANDPMASLVADNTLKIASAEFTVYETTGNLYINGANSGEVKTNLSTSFDYVLIKRIGDATVSKSISAAGYATYCSPYALDFSNVEGLTAFIATLNGTVVSFTEVTDVPANTGVLLKGAEGSYEIPVIASSSTDVTNNALKGVPEETEFDPGIFVLLDGEQGVGFYQTTNAFTVGANTAYIPALVNPSRSFIPVDETTAIKAIEDKQQQDGVVYNLAGQRVAKAQKGLYIVGGKKVIK